MDEWESLFGLFELFIVLLIKCSDSSPVDRFLIAYTVEGLIYIAYALDNPKGH